MASRRATAPSERRGAARARSAPAASRSRRARRRRAARAQTGLLSPLRSGPYRRTSRAVPFCDPEGGLMSEWTRGQRRWLRGGLAVLAVTPAFVGIWATISPRGFYDQFPGGGHHWVSAVGAYDEHLVRDVGALYLGSLVLLAFAFAWLQRRPGQAPPRSDAGGRRPPPPHPPT